MSTRRNNKIIFLIMLIALAAPPALAWPSQPHPGFGGPGSVGATLTKDHEAEGVVTGVTDPLEKYFAFKKSVKDTYGFGFGLDYNALLQAVSESMGEDTAAGGVFRLYGNWSLVGRDSGNTGTLVFKVENRHDLGADIVPKELGSEIGYAGLTAIPFSDIGWALTNLYWDQKLLDNRLAFVAGVLDVTDYVDVYGLFNPWTDFNNFAFSTDPTIPAPNQGLGIALRVMASDNIYVIGGIADANGDPTDPDDSINSFFDEGEYFTHLEIGWASSWERRFDDNIHLTAWHADEREQAQVPDGWGLAFSYSRLLNDIWEPFFRTGYAKDGGALWEGSISTGFGYHTPKGSDMLGFGINWSRPSTDTFGPGLDDQITAELYYRWQVLKILAITPDVQILFNPALNPDEDVITVFGLRGRISL